MFASLGCGLGSTLLSNPCKGYKKVSSHGCQWISPEAAILLPESAIVS